MKKLTFVLFVLILAVTLAFSACGGEVTPDTPDVTTEAPATTTEAPATTTVATTTKAPVTTTEPLPVTTTVVAPTVREPIAEITKVDNPDVYRDLYVKDGAVMLMDYYAATPGKEIPKSKVWENEKEPASTRFAALNSMHAEFIWYTKSEPIYFSKTNAIKGGTCAIVYPHYKSANELNADVMDYYVDSYNKSIYPSYFGNGFLGLGFNTTLAFENLISELTYGDNKDYTIQVFASFWPSLERDSVSNQQALMFGPARVFVSVSSSEAMYSKVSAYDLDTKTWYSPDSVELGSFCEIADFAPVTYTVAIKDAPKNKNAMTDMTLALYLGATKNAEATFKASPQALFKLGEGVDSQVYAIRAYNRVLTDKEVKQNHFADLAMFFGLDVSNFAKLSSTKKNAAYEALAAFNASSLRDDVVAAYEKAVK